MFVDNLSLTQWNVNQCYLLRATCLINIFEAFQILFPTASLIFAAAKLFHLGIGERMKHKALCDLTSLMVVDIKL